MLKRCFFFFFFTFAYFHIEFKAYPREKDLSREAGSSRAPVVVDYIDRSFVQFLTPEYVYVYVLTLFIAIFRKFVSV